MSECIRDPLIMRYINIHFTLLYVLAEFDCPVFEDLYDCVCHVAGGSLAAADCICSNTADIAINWCGGWHHAKRYIAVIIRAVERLIFVITLTYAINYLNHVLTR